jgi:hypothetical protein
VYHRLETRRGAAGGVRLRKGLSFELEYLDEIEAVFKIDIGSESEDLWKLLTKKRGIRLYQDFLVLW